LEALDGIGPVLASRIVAYRNANGPFVTLEALLEVSGIGPAKFAQFKEKIRL
jgi:competence protein ComEA